MSGTELDRPFAARVLADAFHSSVAAAASKHGVSSRTIFRWRTILDEDDVLSRLYSEAMAAGDGEWRHELRAVAVQSCRSVVDLQRRIGAAIEAMDTADVDPIQHIQMLTQAQSDTLRVMQAAVETLVQYEALVDVVGTPALALVPTG